MGKFRHLDVPRQWTETFTKYPHGLTIFEALVDWTSQVDKMVDNINDWNGYLDDFVDNFEFDLQEEVKATIEKWQSTGLLDDIINSALTTELDDVKTQLTDAETRLADAETQITDIKGQLTDISINVKNFGVVGDGVTDDYPALQELFDMVPSGSTVLFPPGEYLISTDPGTGTTQLRIDASNLHIVGYGATILCGNRSILPLVIRPTDPGGTISNIVVEGLTFKDPDPENNYEPPYEETHGVEVRSAKGVKILNCTFIDLGDEGVSITLSEDVEVTGCLFEGTPYHPSSGGAININGCKRSLIHNNTIKNVAYDFGVHLESSPGRSNYDTIITNNIFENNFDGVFINSSGGEVVNLNISNNQFKNTSRYAVGPQGSSNRENIIVDSNIIIGGGYELYETAIFLRNCKNIQVINNIIQNWGTTSASRGVWVDGGTVAGNLIDGVYDSGIRAEGIQPRVVNNRVYRCGLESNGVKTGIHLLKTGIVSGNHVEDCQIGIRAEGVEPRVVNNMLVDCVTSLVTSSSTDPVIINTPL